MTKREGILTTAIPVVISGMLGIFAQIVLLRELLVNFDFLPTGKTYTATIYQDASNADWEKNPEAYQIQKISVDSQTKRTIKIAKGGGFAISIK